MSWGKYLENLMNMATVFHQHLDYNNFKCSVFFLSLTILMKLLSLTLGEVFFFFQIVRIYIYACLQGSQKDLLFVNLDKIWLVGRFPHCCKIFGLMAIELLGFLNVSHILGNPLKMFSPRTHDINNYFEHVAMGHTLPFWTI